MRTFTYRAALAADRGPMPKAFVQAIIDTGRFFQNARGKILFLTGTQPDKFMEVGRGQELVAILEDGNVLQIDGDPMADSDWQGMWFWLRDRRFLLPDAGNRPNTAVSVRK